MNKLKYDRIFQYMLKIVSASLVVYALYFMMWTVFETETGNGDNVEHIHSTWLVSQGKVPYKDFFQHHNPLLWYIFAPFIGFVKSLVLLLDIAHFIGIFAGIVTFWFVYKISSTFFASSIASVLSLLVLCPAYFYIFCFNFNPDTFMALTYVIGLYYLFLYWQTPKTGCLIVSFLSFFLSFMFTQKILIVFGFLGLISLFVFYKKKTPLSDILYALLLPVLLLALFLTYLHTEDALGIYWKSNYLFNIEMQKYYGDIRTGVVDRHMLEPAFALAFISICAFFLRGNIYIKIVSIMFVTEFVQRYFYFSISPYYMLPLMVYTVFLNSVIIDKLLNYKKEIAVIFLLVATYYSSICENKYLGIRGTNRDFVNYINANVTPCDYVLGGFLGVHSVISKDPHYYWALLGHIDVVGDKIGIAPMPNVTKIVRQYLPKLIFGADSRFAHLF